MSRPTGDWLLWWAAPMTLAQGYIPTFFKPFGTCMPNGSLWTIPVELEFYLFVPALYFTLRLHRRRGDALMLAVLLASLAAQTILVYGRRQFAWIADYDFLFGTLAPYLWMFLIGLLIQRNWPGVRGYFVNKAAWWLLGYLLICIAARSLHLPHGGNNINPLFLLPLAGLVISCAMSAPTLSDKTLHRRDLSYGTYIYHMLVINLMLQFGVHAGLLAVTTTIMISLVLAGLSWAIVEKPFLMGKRRALRDTDLSNRTEYPLV